MGSAHECLTGRLTLALNRAAGQPAARLRGWRALFGATQRPDCDSIESMSAEVKQLLREALKLSTGDRAELAAELLASLDESGDSGDIEDAWAAEIERRARRVLAGGSSGTPWEEVRERLERDLLKR